MFEVAVVFEPCELLHLSILCYEFYEMGFCFHFLSLT